MRGSRFRVPRWRLEAAIVKLHPRRVTSLTFHPTRHNLVISGDKKGNVGLWNHEQVYDKTLYSPHTCIANRLVVMPGAGERVASASADGTCKLVDLETGCTDTLLDLNPGGWVPGVTTEKTWVCPLRQHCAISAWIDRHPQRCCLLRMRWGAIHGLPLTFSSSLSTVSLPATVLSTYSVTTRETAKPQSPSVCSRQLAVSHLGILSCSTSL